MLKDSTTQEERGVRMSKKRYEIVSYDIPLWLKPVLSVTETSIYTGISANKIYEMLMCSVLLNDPLCRLSTL